MRYSGAIFRPPSEASSLLLQVTIGCSHNKCTFCTMYVNKGFKVRSLSEIEKDLRDYPNKESVKRVFLMDGDALVLSVDKLVYILDLINELFPNVTRVSSYATFNDLANKTVEELSLLNKKGLKLLYVGLESGSDSVLEFINKNCDSSIAIAGAKKARESNIKLSVMIIAGLGGKKYFEEHINDTAKVINKINPDYLGLLKLNVFENTKMYDQIKSGEFVLLDPVEIVMEMKYLVSKLELTNCLFSSAHASNHINVSGRLPDDKNIILERIDYYLRNKDLFNFYKGL